MKKVLSLICLVVIIITFSSCIFNNAVTLSSQFMNSTANTVNPALTEPQKGIHPYISGAYTQSDPTTKKRSTMTNSIEEIKEGFSCLYISWVSQNTKMGPMRHSGKTSMA